MPDNFSLLCTGPDGAAVVMDWADFEEANADMGDDLDEARACLLQTGRAQVGGGASPLFALTLIEE